MEKKEKTGYTSIDKPWEMHYRKHPVREINTDQTIYELVFHSNKDNLSLPAIQYMHLTWSFNQLKEKVDCIAGALYNSGIGLGDVVLIGAFNCPETVCLLLALNKIGAVSKWFDIRAGEKDIEDYINESKCVAVVAFDVLLPRLYNIIGKISVKKIMAINATSIFATETHPYIKTEHIDMPPDDTFVLFWEYINKTSVEKDIPHISFDKNRPSIMVQSSGTTGKPKVIVHSDFSVTSAAKKLAWSDLPIEKGKKVFAPLPPWIAYDLEMAITYPLSVGAACILGPNFEPDALIPYLGRFTIAFAAPFHYRYLYEHFDELSDKQQKAFVETTECLNTGGDKMTIEEYEEFEKKFQVPVVNGYGNNEGWACLTVNPVRKNCHGSVGIPKYSEIVISYDNEREKELSYGEIGEICFLTDTALLYYENNPLDTQTILKVHRDGKKWLHTGDLGYISEDGFVFLQGRIRRVIIRAGFKISAYTIEDKICELPDVRECVVVEVPDKEEEHVPMAYIVLKRKNLPQEEAKNKIYDKCKKELKANEIPKYFQFVNELPYTENGKYDFRFLEQQGAMYVTKMEG